MKLELWKSEWDMEEVEWLENGKRKSGEDYGEFWIIMMISLE